MATGTKTLTSAYQHVATGPGWTYVSFEDRAGTFAITGSSDPSAISVGLPVMRRDTSGIYLAAGEYLHLRGFGTAVITAGTLA